MRFYNFRVQRYKIIWIYASFKAKKIKSFSIFAHLKKKY